LGSEPRIVPLAAGGKAEAANEVAKHFGGVVVAALHEATEPVAAEGMRDVVAFQGVIVSARSGIAEG
jgi:hypothetical protein